MKRVLRLHKVDEFQETVVAKVPLCLCQRGLVAVDHDDADAKGHAATAFFAANRRVALIKAGGM